MERPSSNTADCPTLTCQPRLICSRLRSPNPLVGGLLQPKIASVPALSSSQPCTGSTSVQHHQYRRKDAYEHKYKCQRNNRRSPEASRCGYRLGAHAAAQRHPRLLVRPRSSPAGGSKRACALFSRREGIEEVVSLASSASIFFFFRSTARATPCNPP